MGGGEVELSDSIDMKLQISQHSDDRNDSMIAQGWLGEETDCKGHDGMFEGKETVLHLN